MKIYGSTQWVDPLENKEWYFLEVINQWDLERTPICFWYFGGQVIPYCLNKNTSISDTQVKKERITQITQEMKDELVKMGYVLN